MSILTFINYFLGILEKSLHFKVENKLKKQIIYTF